MNTVILLKICLVLAVGLTAFLLLTCLKEHKVFSTVAGSVYEKAKEQEEERQSEQSRLLLIEGRQEKTNLLYKLDLLVLQSNIRKIIPFASTEILLILTIALSAAGFAVATSITGTWIFGILGFIGVTFLCYMVLYFMARNNYRKTEESLMTFINLLENYSSMENELIAFQVRKKGKSLKGMIGALLKWSFGNQQQIDKDIIKAAGVSAGRVTLGIPGMGRAKKIIEEYYMGGGKK